MTAEERRRAILEALCARRHETRENLAFEFGVSKRTIEYDVVRLSQSYPIYTTKGTGGGIHVMDGYRLDEKYLSEPERSFLERVGGMLSGIGSGMTIRYGGTMDGMETLAVIFSKRLGLTVGNFVMIFNVILYITIGATVTGMGTGDFTIPLFSIIAYYVNGKAVDFISQGIDQAKGAIIITTEYDTVASALSAEFGRGLTIIDAKGYYSQSDKKFIYCVVNRFQVAKLRLIVAKYDKHAFVTINDIADVFGTSVKNSRLTDKRRREKLQKIRELAHRQERQRAENADGQSAEQTDAPLPEETARTEE